MYRVILMMTLVNGFELSLLKNIMIPKQNVICQRNVPIEYMPTIVDTTSKLLSNPKLDPIIIPSIGEMDFQLDEDKTLFPSLTDEYASLTDEYATHSKFHSLRYSLQKNDISYQRYCDLEFKISEIVKSYLNDKRRHYCLFIDRELLYTDGIPHYLSKQEYQNTLFITDSIEVGMPDIVLWSNEKQINV